MRRVDGYLSRKAQAHWREAIVHCDVDSNERWELSRGRMIAPIALGDSFGAAQGALAALIAAKRACAEGEDETTAINKEEGNEQH